MKWKALKPEDVPDDCTCIDAPAYSDTHLWPDYCPYALASYRIALYVAYSRNGMGKPEAAKLANYMSDNTENPPKDMRTLREWGVVL